MPAYQYIAYDKAGKEKSGSLSVESEKHARRQLKEQGLFLTSLRPEKAKGGAKKTGKSFSFRSRISNFDLALILRQLAILIKSGLPLEDAMTLMVEQAESEKQANLVSKWRTEIVEGRSLSVAMKRSEANIPEAVIAGIGVGEETGHLHSIMERLSEELEVGAQNRQTFVRGLTYPAILLLVSILAMVLLMVFVVPELARVFESTRQELPLITVMVVAVSDFVRATWLYVTIVLVVSLIGFKFWVRAPARKIRWHRFLLRLPVSGKWMEMSNIADWARSLGLLLGSGVPALASLRISSSVMTNLYLRQRAEAVNEQMRRGASLHNALKAESVGTGFLHHMVSSGEASSELDNMLVRVAEYYSARLKTSVDTYLKLMNPILIVLMGLIIVTIVAAVMLPIIELSDIG